MTRVAVIQMVSSKEVAISLQQASGLLGQAAAQGAEVMFLPENFACLGHSNPAAVAAASQEAVLDFLVAAAQEHEAWLFAGTLPMRSRPDGTVLDTRVRAASLVIDPGGRIVARYDKIHMFDVDVADAQRSYRESATFEPGDELCTVDTPCGRVGLTVCYDLRFPVMYSKLAGNGAVCFAVPSAFTVPTGKAHFRVLAQARAIEHFCFVIAACQGGEHDSGRQTYGHSMVVSPWGEILAEAGTGPEVLVVDIDLEEVHRARRDIPVLDQRQSGVDE